MLINEDCQPHCSESSLIITNFPLSHFLCKWWKVVGGSKGWKSLLYFFSIWKHCGGGGEGGLARIDEKRSTGYSVLFFQGLLSSMSHQAAGVWEQCLQVGWPVLPTRWRLPSSRSTSCPSLCSSPHYSPVAANWSSTEERLSVFVCVWEA